MACKYPNISVDLSEVDGNAFSILGAVTKAMRRAQCTPQQIEEFRAEAIAGNYDHLVATVFKFVEVD